MEFRLSSTFQTHKLNIHTTEMLFEVWSALRIYDVYDFASKSIRQMKKKQFYHAKKVNIT